MDRSTPTIFLIASLLFGMSLQAAIITSNIWTVVANDNTMATGTLTDASVPGFSADFTVLRQNVVSFGNATWSGGAQINLLTTGTDPIQERAIR